MLTYKLVKSFMFIIFIKSFNWITIIDYIHSMLSFCLCLQVLFSIDAQRIIWFYWMAWQEIKLFKNRKLSNTIVKYDKECWSKCKN